MSASDKPTNTKNTPPFVDNNNEEDSDTNVSSPGLSPTWGSYNNLARMMLDTATGKQRFPNGLQGFMSSVVTATEKIDGSNLGMWVKYLPQLGGDGDDNENDGRVDPNNWAILLLQGRNAPLWQKDGFEIYANGEENEENEKEDPAVIRKQLQDDLKRLIALPGYGNAGKLDKLILHMRNFIVRFANIIKVDQVEVFGEAFRASRIVEHANAKKEIKKFVVAADRASFHPFGFKIPTATKMQLTRLTSATHKLFCDAVDTSTVPKIPQTHEEMIEFLMSVGATTSKDSYAVFPPPMYCEKIPLVDCIETVAPVLLRKDPKTRDFEGVFIVHEEGWFGCKFKCGTHDEQSRVPSLDELGLEVHVPCSSSSSETKNDDDNDEETNKKRTTPLSDFEKKIVNAFDLINRIFKIKIPAEKGLVKSKPPADPAANDRKKLDQLIATDIDKATQREFSKMLAFDHIDRAKRQPIIDQLLPLVMKEVQKVYSGLFETSDDGVKMPYTEEQLKQKCPNVVKGLVLKVPYNEPAAGGGGDGNQKENDDE